MVNIYIDRTQGNFDILKNMKKAGDYLHQTKVKFFFMIPLAIVCCDSFSLSMWPRRTIIEPVFPHILHNELL